MKRQQTLAGTGTLLLFMLRRDRITVPVWMLSIILLVLATLASFESLYPTEEARQDMAATMLNPAAIALTGPGFYLEDYTIGAMISHQMIGMTGIATGLMSIILVIRHTRKEEETGRVELVRASVTDDTPTRPQPCCSYWASTLYWRFCLLLEWAGWESIP
ncbi:hypothetical protein ABEV74_09405 [Paenibacillus cisolokensis]|uniref:hypothetical protein n=1 Tax=Paenibacillus cisolokensis TaxID=1658519 RepID=UPI003D2B76A2